MLIVPFYPFLLTLYLPLSAHGNSFSLFLDNHDSDLLTCNLASNEISFSNSSRYTHKASSSYRPSNPSLTSFSGSSSLSGHDFIPSYAPGTRGSVAGDGRVSSDSASRTIDTTFLSSTRPSDTPVSNSKWSSTILQSSFNSTSPTLSDTVTRASTVGSTDPNQTLSQLDAPSPSPPTGIVNTTGVPGNGTVDIDACFTQWTSFWSASASEYSTVVSTIGRTTWSSSEVTSTTVFPVVYPTTSIDRSVYTETETQYAGGYPLGEETSTWTDSLTYTYSSYSPASTSTTTYERSSADWPSKYTTITTGPSLVTPACRLPSVVPQCQSQWASYASRKITNTAYDFTSMPVCPHASIGTALCDDLRDQYLSSWIENYADNPYVQPYLFQGAGSVGVASTLPNGSVVWTSTFPTASSFAPGCTLGCARCAITGGRVRLLYWPVPQTSLLNVTAGAISMTGAGTSTTGQVIASAFGTRLTSPTVYISYHSLYASDSCSAVGANHSATIIPIPESTMLSSLYYTWASWGHVALTSSFNYTDLNTPVPESIFTKQPACQWTGCPGSITAYEPIGETRSVLEILASSTLIPNV